MRANQTKARLLAGKTALGVVCVSGSPLVAEALSLSGFDFVLIDNQHGAWDDSTNLSAFHQISLGPATPFARVAKNDFYAIGRLLDRGALGVVVPMVNSRQEAEAAAFAVRYPPKGGRSAGAFAGDFYGAPDYMAWVEPELYLGVQIETVEAADSAKDILSVEGVDGCWIGPVDLSKSMGVDLSSTAGRQKHEDTIMRVLDACHATGKIPGIYGGTDPGYWLSKGFRFVTTAPELNLLSDTAKSVLAELRSGRG